MNRVPSYTVGLYQSSICIIYIYSYVVHYIFVQFTPASVCLLISHPYVSPHHFPFLIFNHQFALCICVCVFLLYSLVLFQIPLIKVISCSIYSSLTYFIQHNVLQVPPCCHKWLNVISFIAEQYSIPSSFIHQLKGTQVASIFQQLQIMLL